MRHQALIGGFSDQEDAIVIIADDRRRYDMAKRIGNKGRTIVLEDGDKRVRRSEIDADCRHGATFAFESDLVCCASLV